MTPPKKRNDRDAAEQWRQLELLIPGVSKLCDLRAMELPPPKPPENSEAAMTLRGMHITEKKA